ncbi:hypothetical protein [Bosea beijingensis]|uniref:hypothetical protein n=1 Tax=Bosea beijingensis TaxID=3068632 RepID=UPI0027426061|nr:hypothetical protein [Bosea sp. REN20]
MNPIFSTTCAIASYIFEIAQTLGRNPARKTRGVFFVPEGASEHLRALIAEAMQRPDEVCHILEPEGAFKKFRYLLPFSDQYSSCVRHLAERISNSPDAIVEVGGFDNLNPWEKESLLESLAEGQLGTIFSPNRVSLVGVTFVVRINAGFPAQSLSFQDFLRNNRISLDEAARVHFYGCFE